MADHIQSSNPPTRKPLTAERLREVLFYDPETGVWTWLKTLSSRKIAGLPAGEIKPSGYRFIGVDGQRYRAHRLAWLYMTGEWPALQIDHVNGSRSDNRWGNLRQADQTHNSANMRMRDSNRAGIKGVSLYKGVTCVKYRAHITVAGICRHLGSFDSAEAARRAYEKAARAQWGEFARVT